MDEKLKLAADKIEIADVVYKNVYKTLYGDSGLQINLVLIWVK